MAGYLILLYPLYQTGLEDTTIGFHHGLPTGDHSNATVYEHSKGIQTPKDDNNRPMVLKLIRNIYGEKQGPKVWGDFLHQGLSRVSFKQSQVDPCLYYREGLIVLVYIDDCVLLSHKDELIDHGINNLCRTNCAYPQKMLTLLLDAARVFTTAKGVRGRCLVPTAR